jgi:hypothetical protein
MKLVETKVAESTVRVRFADHVDPLKAANWIDMQLPLAELRDPYGEGDLGDPELRYLAEVRLAALRSARDVIGAEIQRLSNLYTRLRL